MPSPNTHAMKASNPMTMHTIMTFFLPDRVNVAHPTQSILPQQQFFGSSTTLYCGMVRIPHGRGQGRVPAYRLH
eukprot:752393-Rhodomonas_salina.3